MAQTEFPMVTGWDGDPDFELSAETRPTAR
jgi:hypothetical protein